MNSIKLVTIIISCVFWTRIHTMQRVVFVGITQNKEFIRFAVLPIYGPLLQAQQPGLVLKLTKSLSSCGGAECTYIITYNNTVRKLTLASPPASQTQTIQGTEVLYDPNDCVML